MSSLATALVSWDEFLNYPDTDEAGHHELHDGEVVLMPPPRPVHLFLQARILDLLQFVKGQGMSVMSEFPYKPAPNYQFWYADLAVFPETVLNSMANWKDYQLYAPPLIIEVLSPSNRASKIRRQLIIAMSYGTTEFWIVDAETKTVHITTSRGAQTRTIGDTIQLTAVPEASIEVSDIFEGID